jgi:hypothetical protein
MIFAECDVAINFANADSIEHCLTDSELRATHGHVEEGIWADRSQCEAYYILGFRAALFVPSQMSTKCFLVCNLLCQRVLCLTL